MTGGTPFGNIRDIFINGDSGTRVSRLIGNTSEGDSAIILLSGGDLATVTRLHGGNPRGSLYNYFADWKNKSPLTSSVNQACTVFCNDYVEKNVQLFMCYYTARRSTKT